MPNYAEINHASAELSAELVMLNLGRTFGNAEMLWLWGLSGGPYYLSRVRQIDKVLTESLVI